MRTHILIVSILMLGLLTLPAASAGDAPIVAISCNLLGPDGLVVESARCVAEEGGKNTDKVCRLLFGDSCRAT